MLKHIDILSVRNCDVSAHNASFIRKGVKCLTMIMLSVLGVLAFTFSAEAALTAEQVAQKAASVVAEAKGINVTFTISGNGRTSKGALKSAGRKFVVSLPDVKTWYNGKSLYTYNPRIGETTVTTPTAQELLESNPLLYVNGGGSAYTYKFSTVKRNGKYVIDLVPRASRNGLKKLTLTINASNFKTERIAVATSGGTATIDVTSFITGNPAPASEFEYPQKKYPNAEIIDLR